MCEKHLTRIKWLEELVEKASKYIDDLEAENKRLKEDREMALEQFEEVVEENKAMKKRLKILETENKNLNRELKVYKALFEESYALLNKMEKELLEKKSKIRFLETSNFRNDIVFPKEDNIKEEIKEEVRNTKEEVVASETKLERTDSEEKLLNKLKSKFDAIA